MNKYKIALIPDDGIGNEVIPVSAKVLDKAAALAGFEFEYANFDS